MLLPRCFVFLTNGLQLTNSSWHPLQGTASCCLLWKKSCNRKIEHLICWEMFNYKLTHATISDSVLENSLFLCPMLSWSSGVLSICKQMKFICMFLWYRLWRLKWDSEARTKRNLFRFRWVFVNLGIGFINVEVEVWAYNLASNSWSGQGIINRILLILKWVGQKFTWNALTFHFQFSLRTNCSQYPNGNES